MRHLLIIDDDPQFRSFLVTLLRRRGYKISELESGERAREMLQANRFDAVITDIFMPRMEGIETIQELKAQVGDCKIIAMSGGGSSPVDFLGMAEKLGATAVLRKPFAPAEILNLLKQLLGP
jgi:CheY-like chemotaxis protein